MDIQVSELFDDVNSLGVYNFAFDAQIDEKGIVRVYVDRGWTEYMAQITFNNAVFSTCPKRLEWNIRCRVATEEETRQLRSQHAFPASATAYCFNDTSTYYIKGPLLYAKDVPPLYTKEVPHSRGVDVKFFYEMYEYLDPEFREAVHRTLELNQQQKSFVVAESVKIVVFWVKGTLDNLTGQWRKGRLDELPENWQHYLLNHPSSAEEAAKWDENLE